MFQNFLRPNLDILFVGLNPAPNSWNNGHYFSSKGCFLWRYLYESGLITAVPPLQTADEQIFSSTEWNYKNWNFGITDLCPEIIDVDSNKVNPTFNHVEALANAIRAMTPKIVVCMGEKVCRCFYEYARVQDSYKNNMGNVGQILSDSSTSFFFVFFPANYARTKEGFIKSMVSVREWLDNHPNGIELDADSPVSYFLEENIGNHHVVLQGDHRAALESVLS